MFCPNCNKQIEDDSVFCGFCGTNIAQAAAQMQPEQSREEQPQEEQPREEQPREEQPQAETSWLEQPQDEPPQDEPPQTEQPQTEQPHAHVPPTPPSYYQPPRTMYVDTPPARQGGSKTVLIVSIICAAVVALALIFVFLILPELQEDQKSDVAVNADDIEDMVKDELKKVQEQMDDAADGMAVVNKAPVDDAVADDTSVDNAPVDNAPADTMPEPVPTPLPTPAPTPSPTPAATPYYIIPGSDVRYITMADLVGLNQYEAQLARNELYARYGHNFRTEWIQDYFEGQMWYVNNPKYGYNAQMPPLTKIEQANATFIKNYERSKGWLD